MKHSIDVDESFGEWVMRKHREGAIDADSWLDDDYQTLVIVGRRTFHDTQTSVEYVKHATIADAWKYFEAMSFPTDFDGIVSEDGYGSRCRYHVSIEGSRVGSYATQDEAEYRLAEAMVDGGVYPDCWLINDRGNYVNIGEKIRDYHDEGGDKMKVPDAVFGELSELMDFEHVIQVHEGGLITEPRDIWAPTLLDDSLDSDKWELLTGYSGQDRYSGPIMHNSEFIGGGLERDILATPGVYVAVVSSYSNVCAICHEATTVVGGDSEPERLVHMIGTDDDYDHEASDDEYYVEGWAVARLKA